jgi:hypothetical protein
MSQRYSAPVALERMRLGNCPECGAAPDDHSHAIEFWLRPGGCDLLPIGVTDRIARFEQDRAEVST